MDPDQLDPDLLGPREHDPLMATTRPNTSSDLADLAAPLIAEYLGISVTVVGASQPTRTLTYSRDLNATEMGVVERILRSFSRITPAEREALENDVAGLRQYQDIATPTLAQTVLAVKAQSRILRALWRD